MSKYVKYFKFNFFQTTDIEVCTYLSLFNNDRVKNHDRVKNDESEKCFP